MPLGRKQIPNSIRELIIKRDGINCKNCGKKGIREDWYGKVRIVEKEPYKKLINFDGDFILVHRVMEFDHIIPRNESGKNIVSNIQILCRTCNRKLGKWHKDEC